jgi:DNA-binding beta-propeller fold protein YncE
MRRTLCVVLALATMVGRAAYAAPTRSSPIAVAPDGTVFAVNPDSGTLARLDFSSMVPVLTDEGPVGTYPRTVTLAGGFVFTANQKSDDVTRCSQAPGLGSCTTSSVGAGCNPYGIAATPAGDALVVTCQGTSEVLLLTPSLEVTARVKLAWPNARAIAISSDGSKAYVTHFLTEEPGTDGHVSVVDLANKSVAAVFTIAADLATCETQNSGQGVLNQLSAIALVPDGAPSEVAGQLWVGGEQENNVSKGLFKREPAAFCDVKKLKHGKSICVPKPGTRLFPLLTFTPFPTGGVNRDKYQPSFHDIIRLGIVKVNAADGSHVGKIDIDEAAIATDIEFSADGTTAYVVDQTFNSFHLLNTKKGQGSDVTTLFAPPGSNGPGGADPTASCIAAALTPVTSEVPFRMAPQAQITTIDGYNPVDPGFNVVHTGVDFDTVAYQTSGVSQMRPIADGVGTAPIGVRLSPAGDRAYVLNYLARNVVAIASAQPLDTGGKPANLRCTANANESCATDNDCPVTSGFCNHPGGNTCTTDADCGTAGPCVRSSNCVPLVLAGPVSTIQGRCVGGTSDGAVCKGDADCTGGACSGIKGDPVAAAVLDGKILFTTAARDASVPNDIGLGQAAPLFNEPYVTCASGPKAGQKCLHQADCGDKSLRLCSVGHNMPGEMVSVAHDASYVSCTTCHADFGGQDGRTWDFSQFGASLRNTMDLRGRPAFSPGTCSGNPSQECTFDAACGPGSFCKANPATVPPNVPAADRDRWFNPMLTVHWNGDRDEVEDFEFTFRQLQGSGDCDGVEDISKTCMGALVQRDSATTTELPRANSVGQNDVEPELAAPNRNLPGEGGHNVGVRLTHLADFVYSLTDFPKNPNQPDAATERGRTIFNDPVTQCGDCHNGGHGGQFFTDKAPTQAFDPGKPARGDSNNPFVRHDVGTSNVFDQTDPYAVGLDQQILQNTRIPIPGQRGSLGDYVTPVIVDVWNTAPYLHDGSAPTLLDVVRPCDTTLDDCTRLGAGRSIHDAGTGKHGKTDVLTPLQLNDLVAFQKVLTTSTVLGTRARVVKAGTMTIANAKVSFGRVRKQGRMPGTFKIAGTFGNAPVTIDPSTGVSMQLATPGAGAMVVLDRTFTMESHGSRFVGKTTDGGGVVALTLRAAPDGSYRFTLIGKQLDLSALDTGNPDLTVALLVGDAQFVRNRTLVARKQIYALPKKKR